jgi:branched-chain amino acid transport system substrate-binding protein
MKHRILSGAGMVLLAVLVMSLLFAFGCSTSQPTSSPSSAPASTTPVSADSKILKIGVAVRFGLAWGIDTLHGMELMAEQDNKNGGLSIGGEKYKIQLVEYDSGASQDTEKTAINRLAFQDNVKFIIDVGIAPEAWVSVTEANKVIVLQWKNDFAFLPKYNYTFNGSGISPQSIAVPGWIYKNYPDAAKNYVIALPDAQLGHLLGGFLVASCQPFNVTPKTFFYPPDIQDFSSVALKVMSMNPSLFSSIGGPESQMGQMCSALRQAGYKGLFFFPPTTSSETLKNVLSPEALDGFLCSAGATEFDPPLNQSGKDYKAAWIAKYGKWENPDTAYLGSYSCLKAALQQAGSIDVDKVAAALNGGLKYDSPIGPMQMMSRPDFGNDRTVDSIGTYYIKQMTKDGQPKLLTTISPEEALSFFRTVNPALPPGATYIPQGPPPGAGGPGGPPPDAGGPGGPPPGGQ